MMLPAHWLTGHRAFIAGTGAAADCVESGLEAAGASVTRGGFVMNHEDAAAALGDADILVHVPPEDEAPDFRAALSAGLDSRFFYSVALARRCLAAEIPGAVLHLALPAQSAGVVRAACGAALETMVKSLAVEWARDGIRVNGIVSRHLAPSCVADKAKALAALAAYLCSDYAAYVTGALMGLDEGCA